jgi:hypothetical protein
VRRELFWRAVKVQGALMAAAAGVALVASLPREAVADYWPAVALGIWFLSAAVTGRVLSLP